MTISLKLKHLLIVALLTSYCSFTTASTNKNSTSPPEATTVEKESTFWDIPLLDNAFIDATPEDRKDGNVVGKLGVDGGNKDMLIKLAQEIADGKHGKIDSMLIAHKDKLLFESYYLRGRVDLPHPQASATKAYTALVLGRAIQLGHLSMADLDKPLVSFLKNLDSTKFVAGVDKITLDQALTMRGGLRVSEDKWKSLQENPAALKGQKLIQALFENTAPVTKESQNFSYGNFNPELVMQVVEAVVPGTAEDFIKNELLKKMGITNYDWPAQISGLPDSGASASMISRDMVKFGTLAMNNGKWKGEQLISEAFITRATSRYISTGDEELHFGGKDVSNQCYGYFWWCADMKYGGKTWFSTSAQGGFGQFIILIRELDLQVIFTGHDNDANYLQITAERILPAFVD